MMRMAHKSRGAVITAQEKQFFPFVYEYIIKYICNFVIKYKLIT